MGIPPSSSYLHYIMRNTVENGLFEKLCKALILGPKHTSLKAYAAQTSHFPTTCDGSIEHRGQPPTEPQGP